MRAFVAIDVPGEVLDSLVGFQSEVSATGADLKLVDRENLHFTIKFLGEVSEAQAADAQSRLASLDLQRVTVDVHGVGAFPTSQRPRVIWAGVAHDHERLVAYIAGAAIAALKGIGERDDRPFQAHITVARVRSYRDSRKLGELLQINSGRSFGKAPLSELKLKSSTLTPGGPVYKDVGVFPLR